MTQFRFTEKEASCYRYEQLPTDNLIFPSTYRSLSGLQQCVISEKTIVELNLSPTPDVRQQTFCTRAITYIANQCSDFNLCNVYVFMHWRFSWHRCHGTAFFSSLKHFLLLLLLELGVMCQNNHYIDENISFKCLYQKIIKENTYITGKNGWIIHCFFTVIATWGMPCVQILPVTNVDTSDDFSQS